MSEDDAIVTTADEFSLAVFKQSTAQGVHRSGVRMSARPDFELHAEIAQPPTFDRFVAAGCPEVVAHCNQTVDGAGVCGERPNKFTARLPNPQVAVATARDPSSFGIEVVRAVQAALVMGDWRGCDACGEVEEVSVPTARSDEYRAVRSWYEASNLAWGLRKGREGRGMGESDLA